MIRNVTMADINKDAGRIIASVDLKGDSFLISRYGRPSAALVPIEVLEIYESSRQALYDYLVECQRLQAGKDPVATERAIEEAMAEVRPGWKIEPLNSKPPGEAS